MEIWNLKSITIYLAVLSLVFVLLVIFRKKIPDRFGSTFFLILYPILIIYNLISFPTFTKANEWNPMPLPSNELVDLFKYSLSPSRTSWIYPLIENYYVGRTLLVSGELLDSFELSQDRLLSQGRLESVNLIDYEISLTSGDLDLILDLESIYFLNVKKNQDYYFVLEEQDPSSPLLLLRYENQLFFIPQDLLPDREENQ